MALSRKITKATFDSLPDVLKSEYKEKDGSYFLDTDDASGLESALEAQKTNNAKLKADMEALQASLAEIQAAKEAAEGDKNKKNKDYDALEASWKAKLDKAAADNLAAQDKLKKQIETMLVDNKAQELATALFGENADIALPHVKSRLKADFDGEQAVTRVLDKTGAVSASTLEDLSKEFIDNPKFSRIVVASRATGGNANGGNGTGNAVPKDKKPEELNSQERQDLLAKSPEEFYRLYPHARGL